MNSEQLHFLFSLFSFVGVVGILFYMVLEKAKSHETAQKIQALTNEIITLKNNEHQEESSTKIKDEVLVENLKEKIIALYEEGADVQLIESALNVPKAKIEMVLKFHNLNKSDNWRESVNNTL